MWASWNFDSSRPLIVCSGIYSVCSMLVLSDPLAATMDTCREQSATCVSLITRGSGGTAHTCSGRHSQYSCELLAWVPGVALHSSQEY